MADPENVAMGPGWLYVADIGTAEPTAASAVLPVDDWRQVGYTEDGNEFKYTVNNEAIEVAEEFDPIAYRTTSRAGEVTFQMAESTIENLALALNKGAQVDPISGQTLEPPAPGAEVRVMIALKTDTGALWLFRRCFQGGDVTLARKKAPDKTLIPVTFRLEKPAGVQPFKVWKSPDGLV